MSENIYTIFNPSKLNEIVNLLSGNYKIEQGRKANYSEIYYDTFDWRLFERNLVFIHTGKELSLFSFAENKKIISSKSKTIKQKYFANNFSKIIQDKVCSIIQLRALIKICWSRRISESYRIMNEDDKTVIRMYHEMLNISSKDNKEFTKEIIRFVPLKGYEDTLVEITRALYEKGFVIEDENYLRFIYKHFGRVPGYYSSKIKMFLDPKITSIEAERLILTKLIDVIIECENGITNDIDIEFLHDYRVSIRKARTLLSELKKVLPQNMLTEFKRIFSEMGTNTNILRDLDVNLLNKPRYESYLPEFMRSELNPLFNEIKKERVAEFRKLKCYLASEHYKNNILQLEILLEGDFKNGITEEAYLPIIVQSNKVISRRCRNILKNGRKIDNNSMDDDFHNLRLECKKLRYLLELFASLYPADEINYLIEHLKKLQDNLGDFNDLSVQQDKMKYYLDKINGELEKQGKMASVLGGLITSLHKRHMEVRDEFFETFRKFDSAENKKIIKKLFETR